MMPSELTIPGWRSALRHAAPNVVEGKVLPTVLFIALLQLVGSTTAVIGALIFALGAMVRRHNQGKEMSGLLVLTTLALLTKTIAALVTGSLFVYFLQPTVATFLVGFALFGSVVIGRPLVERLALDFCPLEESARSHPTLRRFFRHSTLWWSVTSMMNFSITLWLLLSQSTTTFVLVKSVLGPLTTAATVAVAYVWFRVLMARSGTSVVFADIPRTS